MTAIVVMIASAIVFVRLQLLIMTIAPTFWSQAAPPLTILLFLLAVASLALWLRHRNEQNEMPTQENPSELKSALLFGLIYAVVLFVVAAVKERFGSRGLYLVAGVSGLTDVDAITISTARLVHEGRLSATDGWRLIIVASLSNLVFKTGTVAFWGHRRLLLQVASIYTVVFAAGVLLLLFWK